MFGLTVEQSKRMISGLKPELFLVHCSEKKLKMPPLPPLPPHSGTNFGGACPNDFEWGHCPLPTCGVIDANLNNI